VLVYLLPAQIQDGFALRFNTLENMHFWQLISAHFTHSNVWHLGLNVAGLWLIWLLFWEVLSLKPLLFTLVACTIGLSLAMLLFSDIYAYIGLSGTLHGLFGYALVRELPYKRPSTFLLIIVAISKLAYEQFGGSVENTAALIGVNVAIDGHLWGAIIGVLCGCIAVLFQHIKKDA
jgi:rhomboid family GlyGly-CTERM serine protease